MKTRLLNLWEFIRSSFWLIPGAMVLLSVILSIGILALDRKVDFGLLGLFYIGGEQVARSILSTIAGSMITVAGVTFSITIVALTLTSSQFGPRLLRNFMKDRGNQVVLGTFIATFIYCLFVLGAVDTVEDQVFIPHLSITFAIALALINSGVLIYFIHHISMTIQADSVISAVSRELEEDISRLFPKEFEGESRKENRTNFGNEAAENTYAQTHFIPPSRSGYLQAIDNQGLMLIAEENNLLIRFKFRPGEYTLMDIPVAEVESNEQIDERVINKIQNSFLIGSQRNSVQDAEFAIRQLVEIAVRALSPGVNDPYTAITCVDRLGSMLRFLTTREFPSPYFYDEGGELRIIAKTLTFEGMTNAAFDQIRQYGRSSVAVTIHLLEIFGKIIRQIRNADQRQAILRQAEMLEQASHDAIPEKSDRKDIQERYQALLNQIEESSHV